ncbi:FtsX-like permease family protein [Streptomyces tubercidicus]|uniref:FtsX-like permease family protein n=1 Tax=Streptomyces tubercidicus TaxID=47759 RepID=UPI0034651CB9
MATLRYTVKEFRGQVRQLMLTGAAVAVGVAFLILAVGGSGALVQAYNQMAAAEVGPGDLQVTPTRDKSLPRDTAGRAGQVDGVAKVSLRQLGRGTVLAASGRPLDDAAVVTSVAADPGMRWQQLADGAWPGRAGEVLLDTGTAERLGAKPGDRVGLLKADGTKATGLLTGTLHGTPSLSAAGKPVLGVVDTAVGQYATGVSGTQLDVRGTASAGAVEKALGGDVRVRTHTGSVTAAEQENSQIYGVVLVAALSFVLIAMAVARMVVSNTFSVVLAQRTRQLALLRCIGATQGQVRKTIRIQGLMLGLAASVAGAVVGAGATLGGTALLSLVDLGPVEVSLAPGWITFALATVFGVALTLLAVRGPAKAAAAVPPVAALGGNKAPSAGLVRRGALSFVLLGFGVLMLIVGATPTYPPPLLLLAVTVGAICSFFAVLRLTRWVLPPIVALLGIPARRIFGTTGKLAVQQLRRNPGRTGAAASALLVGVTVAVAAATAIGVTSASLDGFFTAHQPGTFALATDDGKIPAKALDAVRAEQGLKVTEVRTATMRINGKETVVVSADPGMLNSSMDDVERARALKDGEALSVSRNVKASGVTVTGARSELPYRLREGASLFVTPATLDRIAPGAPVGAVWISPRDGNQDAARKALDRALADVPVVRVTDLAAQSENVRAALDRMVLVSAVLLGFAMAIAALGVAATLVLGVAERTREIGMLRAIGLCGDQLRRMLCLEAVLLALTSAVGGTALGLVYGWLAGHAVTTMTGTVFEPPVTMIAALLAVTVLIGLAAAILPARRVRRMSIVGALAETG